MINNTFERSWIMGSTPVLLRDEPPEEVQYLQTGQEILSRCGKTGEMGFANISNILIRNDVFTYLLYYKNCSKADEDDSDLRAIEATPTTPIFVINRGWTFLKDLHVGDVVKSFDTTCFAPNSYSVKLFNCAALTIMGIRRTNLSRRVFSLELSQRDEYFIREEGVLIPTQLSNNAVLGNGNHELCESQEVSVGGFPSNTLVHLKNGYLSEMEFVMPGSEVLSRNLLTGELDYHKVLRRVLHEAMPEYLIVYSIQDKVNDLFATVGQQFFIKGHGWMKASDIKIGDLIDVIDGSTATIVSVTKEDEEQQNYFNYVTLEIEDSDCYFVCDGLCVRGF